MLSLGGHNGDIFAQTQLHLGCFVEFGHPLSASSRGGAVTRFLTGRIFNHFPLTHVSRNLSFSRTPSSKKARVCHLAIATDNSLELLETGCGPRPVSFKVTRERVFGGWGRRCRGPRRGGGHPVVPLPRPLSRRMHTPSRA